MGSLDELREILSAGQRPGTVFLPTLFLDDTPRLEAEQGIVSSDLRRAREADLAMHIMALANGYSLWGPRRYLVLGVQADGEMADLPSDILDNGRLQAIVRRFCVPQVVCYYQEHRIRGHRIGMITISDSAEKPYAFSSDVTYRQGGEVEFPYRTGQVWLQKGQAPELASPDEVPQIQLDAALVLPAAGADALTPVARQDLVVDLSAFDEPPLLNRCQVDSLAEGMVAPSGCDGLRGSLREGRVLVICGPAGLGKGTMGDHLARELALEAPERPVFHARRNAAPAPLVSALCEIRASIVVARNVLPEDMQGCLPDVQQALGRNDSFLVLTSQAPVSEWRAGGDLGDCLIDFQAIACYTETELLDILRARLAGSLGALQPIASDDAAADSSGEAENGLKRTLQIARASVSPGAMARLADRHDAGQVVDSSWVAEAIPQVANLRAMVQEWYWGLEYHERYFLLAVCLLDGLPRWTFWRWYERLVAESWRPYEPALRSIPGINARLVPIVGPDLCFRFPGSAEIILDEAISRYPRPLVWALPLLGEAAQALAKESPAGGDQAMAAISGVVGRLAAAGTSEAVAVLQRWAVLRYPALQLAVVEALAAAARSPQGRRAALALLAGWARNVALEEGWAAPRFAYRVRLVAALALGRISWYMDAADCSIQVFPLLWDLAKDTDPRVRIAVARAAKSAGGLRLPEMAGLLGYLANDPSKGVRSHVASGLLSMMVLHSQSVSDILQSWVAEVGTRRGWTGRLTFLLRCGRSVSACEALAQFAEESEGSDTLAAIVQEVCLAKGGAVAFLGPLLRRLADHREASLRGLAVAGLIALARSPVAQPEVKALVQQWQGSPSRRLVETAARWQAEWNELGDAGHGPPAEQAAGPDLFSALEDQDDSDGFEAAAQVALPAASTGRPRGPQRWRRQAPSPEEQRQQRQARVLDALRRLAIAGGIALLAWVILRRFPYYGAQWTPILLLALLVVGYPRPGVSLALAGIVSLLPILYHSPTLAGALLIFCALLMAAGGALGGSRVLEMRLLILGFPVLVGTPLALLLPFLAGWAFRKRSAWLVFWGILLTMIVGSVFGQTVVGDHFGMGVAHEVPWILDRPAPETWRSFGWLLDISSYREGMEGLLGVATSLVDAFTETPFPLVQLGLWCGVAWLVGWAADQAERKFGLGVIASAGLLMLAAYQFILPQVLGWQLPFAVGTALSFRVVAGAIIVMAGLYGWPWARSKLVEHDVWGRARRYAVAALEQLQRTRRPSRGSTTGAPRVG